MNWKVWLHSLAAAAIGGAAAAVGAAYTSPDTFNFSTAGLKHLGVVALFGGGVPVLALLKQSPLPTTSSPSSGSTMVKSIAIIGAFFAASLFMGAWSCNATTSLHKAASAADAIGSSLQTAQSINESALTSGIESTAERDAINSYLVSAAQANDAFVAAIQSAEQSGATTVPAAGVTAFSTLVAQANALNSEGVLKLKSTQAQADFKIVVAAIQTQLAVIQALIPSVGPATPVPVPPPSAAMPAPVCEPGSPCKLHGKFAA